MKIKYLIAVLVLLTAFSGCKDDDDARFVSGQRTPHTMRVKKITGYNEYWKDYTLQVSYVNNKVVDLERFSKTGRKMGGLEIRREQGKVYYRLKDYIPSVDADSIDRMNTRLKNQYGEGNYTLEDSIPLTPTDILMLTVGTVDGVVVSQQFTYYQPTTDFGTGAAFSPKYVAKNRESFVFEYGQDNTILTCRNLADTFDPENSQSYTRVGYKSVYQYAGKQLTGCSVFVAGDEYENNWRTLRSLGYSYSGQDLITISGEGYALQRNYAGGKLTSVTENGITTSYSMNDQGFCIRMEESNGRVMNIEYEEGDGDFEIFNRLDRSQMGFPVIL